MNIEPLESRIAPAAFVLHYTDVDGDAVTVTLSKGSFIYTADTPAGGFGKQIKMIQLNGTDSMGANLTVTATPTVIDGVLRGDGHAAIGYLNATILGGINLGTVTIDGDLGTIDAGNGAGVAVKSLSVASLGAYGTSTGAPDLESILRGSLGSLKVAGSIVGSYLFLGNDGSLGSATIGGSIFGTTANNSGSIVAAHDLGPVTVKGSIVGGLGLNSGVLGAGFSVAGVTIGGSLIGGAGDDSGQIYDGYVTPTDAMGAIKIKGDIASSNGVSPSHYALRSGRIDATIGIASISVGGSLRGGQGDYSATIHTGGTIGSLTVGGSLVGYSDYSASIQAAELKSGKIGGSIIGADDYSGRLVFDRIASLTVGGDLRGDSGYLSGRIQVGAGGIGTLAIGGSVIGGIDPDYQQAQPPYAQYSGTIDSTGDVTKLTIGGSLVGGNAYRSGSMNLDSAVGTLTIGGDLVGGSEAAGRIAIGKTAGTVTIGGSLLGSGGLYSGELSAYEGFGKVVIGGGLAGGFGELSGSLVARNGTIGSVSIAGDVRGFSTSIGATTLPTDTGSILAKRIGNVSIEGSVISGSGVRCGVIISDQDIGAITIEGSLLGLPGSPAKIYAGSPGIIKSITIGGDVSNALIFGGVSDTVSLTGNAQIGPVKVGGDWIASSMGAGAQSGGNGLFGDSDDVLGAGGAASKIASITIGGQVVGRAGTNDTFGIVAHVIGSFKVHNATYPLSAGAGNDTWALGKALALGASRSPATAQKPDAFAVHVFEI